MECSLGKHVPALVKGPETMGSSARSSVGGGGDAAEFRMGPRRLRLWVSATEVHYDGSSAGGLFCALPEFRAQSRQVSCDHAAERHCGRGLQHGPDLLAAPQALTAARRVGPATGRMLEGLMAGGYWAPYRHFEAGYRTNEECNHCGSSVSDGFISFGSAAR